MPAQNNLTSKLFLGFSSFILLSVLFIANPLVVSSVFADNISAVPPRLDLTANPGQTVTATLKVLNGGDNQQLFTISVDDFIVTDNLGTPIPVAVSNNNRWSLKSWITAPDMVPVDAHGTQIVNISLKVPMTALAGGHYAMITYQPHGDIKPADLKKTSSLVAQRVGTLIYLQVNGPITQDASVIKFTTDKFHEMGPIDFSGTIRNLSEIHVNPQGTITIYSPLNAKVAEVPVEVGNIFPEINKDFTSTWNQKWGYGKYRAELNLAYGTAGGLLTATIFFWLFPIRLVIYSLIALVSILFVIIVLNKRNKRHQQDLEKEVQELKAELQNVESK